MLMEYPLYIMHELIMVLNIYIYTHHIYIYIYDGNGLHNKNTFIYSERIAGFAFLETHTYMCI